MPFVEFKRFPWGTLILALSLIIVYVLLSQETTYIPSSSLYEYALTNLNPYSYVTHLFVHVGILHFIGNLIPLILFALVFEMAVAWPHVVSVFLFSGILASFIFALTNPFIALIGASAGISGLLGAALALKPKQALVVLLAIPFLLSFIVIPGATYVDDWYAGRLQSDQQRLRNQYATALNASQYNRSAELQMHVQQLNSSLHQTDKKLETTQEGKSREESVPTDLFVHIYGVLAGLLYVYLFRRKQMMASRKEYLELGDYLISLIRGIAGRKRKRGRGRN
ncbi:rhomboid family intramembrane serine protease [Candidatus Micrarchaeota archaeon]|nr:rhomboid family intramembrane serine protease [Candidatus Micrarchaeota archaeon]